MKHGKCHWVLKYSAMREDRNLDEKWKRPVILSVFAGLEEHARADTERGFEVDWSAARTYIVDWVIKTGS